MTDPSRREAAEAGERQEEVETAHDHTVAPEPADPNAGVVRARSPSRTALFVAATVAAATLIVLIAAGLAA